MTASPQCFDIGTPVTHPRHGGRTRGRPHGGNGGGSIWRAVCNRSSLTNSAESASLAVAIDEGVFGEPSDAVLRAQALCIASINDQWGVFSRSRVATASSSALGLPQGQSGMALPMARRRRRGARKDYRVRVGAHAPYRGEDGFAGCSSSLLRSSFPNGSSG